MAAHREQVCAALPEGVPRRYAHADSGLYGRGHDGPLREHGCRLVLFAPKSPRWVEEWECGAVDGVATHRCRWPVRVSLSGVPVVLERKIQFQMLRARPAAAEAGLANKTFKLQAARLQCPWRNGSLASVVSEGRFYRTVSFRRKRQRRCRAGVATAR
jgi:hypothetical protein